MTDTPFTIGYLLFDGFSNMCLACAVEPVRAANALSGQELTRHRLLSAGDGPVTSSSAITLQPDSSLDAVEKLDILFVIAGYDYRRLCSKDNLAAIRRVARKAKTVAGLDTGSWLLAQAGLLTGYRATIHWQELNLFEEAFPHTEVSAERYVIDRNRYTCGGATTALDLVVKLIRDRFGEALALDVMNLFIYDSNPEAERTQRGARFAPFATRAPLVVAAIEEMERTVEAPVPLAQIAKRVNTSARTLDRVFHRELQTAPGKYYLYIRLRWARNLILETSQSMAEIAARTGFSSAATLSRAFTNQFDLPPRDVRRGRLTEARGQDQARP